MVVDLTQNTNIYIQREREREREMKDQVHRIVYFYFRFQVVVLEKFVEDCDAIHDKVNVLSRLTLFLVLLNSRVKLYF